MHRIDTPTAQADKFGTGKNGFTNGDPSTGRRATDLNSDMWDAVQEEICNTIEKSGITLDKTQHDQLYEAIVFLITKAVPDALLRKNNLSDLMDKVAARTNLGLGNSATRNIGIISGTVAAGDDSRIVNSIQNSGGTITADNAPLTLKNQTPAGALFLLGLNSNNSKRWYIGNGNDNDATVTIGNYASGVEYILSGDGSIFLNSGSNKDVSTNTRFVPSNYSNFDAKYKNTASLGSSGWHKDTSAGLIIQWGSVTIPAPNTTSTSIAFNFPTTYPNAALSITATSASGNISSSGFLSVVSVTNLTKAGGTISIDANNSVNITNSQKIRFLSVGY